MRFGRLGFRFADSFPQVRNVSNQSLTAFEPSHGNQLPILFR